MADQKLNITLPFAGMGLHVYGDRFVGRKHDVRTLQMGCTKCNYSIQGLPKIGKTSLAYHSVIAMGKQVHSDLPLCKLFFNVGIFEEAHGFFVGLVRTVSTALIEVLNEEDRERVHNLHKLVRDFDYDRFDVLSFFEQGISVLPVNVVVVFDEFDKVRNIGFSGSDFELLRGILSVANVKGVVVSKRSIYALENWKKDSNSGPSTFFQVFQGNTIYLKQFDGDDMREYWQRLRPFFEQQGIIIDDDYSNNAEFYAGKHPHLLDVYNSQVYKQYLKDGAVTSLLDLRTEMSRAFVASMDILEAEGLLEAAIQAVIGPVYDLNDEQLDRLEQYDFLQRCPVVQKQRLLGTNLGLTVKDDDGQYAYMATSRFFTLLMRNHYAPAADFWQEWSAALMTLRQLTLKFLIDNWGEDWENAEDADPVVGQMRMMRKKDEDNDISTSPLIYYLLETDFSDMVRRNWTSFQEVFAPLSFKSFFEKFNYLKNIRNHIAHINDIFLSPQNREKANEYLCTITEVIDVWMKQNVDTPLLIKRSIRLMPGMRCEGRIVMTNNMSQPKIKGDFPFVLSIEGDDCSLLTPEALVVFTVGGRPHPKGGTYFFAYDVLVIE